MWVPNWPFLCLKDFANNFLYAADVTFLDMIVNVNHSKKQKICIQKLIVKVTTIAFFPDFKDFPYLASLQLLL